MRCRLAVAALLTLGGSLVAGWPASKPRLQRVGAAGRGDAGARGLIGVTGLMPLTSETLVGPAFVLAALPFVSRSQRRETALLTPANKRQSGEYKRREAEVSGLVTPIKPRASHGCRGLGRAGVVATLVARGLISVFGLMPLTSETFLWWDRRLYSPLCLLLAVLSAAGVVSRR